MDYKNIILSMENGVAVIKFNRPKALNAINPDVVVEVNDALDRIEKDSSVKVLILTGEGEKAFVAGADISHMVNLNPIQARNFARAGHDLCFRLEALPIPVIAWVGWLSRLAHGLTRITTCPLIAIIWIVVLRSAIFRLPIFPFQSLLVILTHDGLK